MDARPDLPPDLQEIIRLFQWVSHSRPPAFSGLAGIRITDIEAVYRLAAVTLMEPDDFTEWMLWLDGVLITWHAERDRAKEKHNG